MREAVGRGTGRTGADMSIDMRLQSMEVALKRMEETNSRIADALDRLVVLETQHAETREALGRSFKATEKLSDRVSEIEKRLPLLDAIMKGAGLALLGILGVIGGALWQLITGRSA